MEILYQLKGALQIWSFIEIYFWRFCFLIWRWIEGFNYFLRSWSRTEAFTTVLSKEKSCSRIPSNQLTNASSEDILIEFDNYIFSVSILCVGLFACIIMPSITFPCLEQSVKLVNLLLSYIARYILKNKGCIQFNCKGANIDFFLQNPSELQVSMKVIKLFTLTLLAYWGKELYTVLDKYFL